MMSQVPRMPRIIRNRAALRSRFVRKYLNDGPRYRCVVWLIESAVDGWIRWRTRRLRVTPIEHVSDGVRVKVTGRLDAGDEPLEAPITGRACAAWSVELQEGPGWATVLVEQKAQEFVIRDRSGRPALIRAERASVVFDRDAETWPRQPTERMQAFLRRHRLRESGHFPSAAPPYRYCEGALEPGEEITVVGVARLEIDPSGTAGSYREPPMRAVFEASRQSPLWILDGPARWRLE